VQVLEDITEQKNNQNVLTIQARIASIFALISNEEQFNEVLKIVLEASSSPFGIFGYLDTDGTFVVPTMTRQVWDQCDIPRKSIRFPREAWGDSSWPRAIREKLSNYSNQPSSSIPEVHVSIQRHISMPILYQGEVIGLFQVANKASDYSETDIQLLSIIAAHVAPLLQAKLQQNISALTLNHANRALETRSLVNRSLVNATEERSLMQAVCQAIVSQRGFRMAWVGYSRHDEDKSIEVMASEGDDRGYLEFARLVWGETERGMGPSGLAIRSGIKQVCQDIAHDPAYLPWRDAALDRGYAAVIALPLFDSEGNVFGILDVYADQLNAFIPSEIKLLAEMSEDLSFGVMALRTRRERNLATKKIQQQFLQLQDNLDNTIKVISTIVEMRDPYTAGHQRRMADLACAIARQMGLPDEQVHGIHIAGIVHDLGKIQIPAEILSKPGKLSSIEYSLIKQHPQAGFDILKGVDFTWPIAQMVLQHHERFDGTGYPQGLKGDATLLEARILGVADVVEALSSHRPYRPGLGIDAALNEITLGRGTHFDSGAVDACLNLFREQGYRFPD
jgi:HD-GYP domain-containing protein (c-di-GMP phosphodiesterase class II)